MTAKETEIISALTSVIPKLSEPKKEYLLGYAEGVIAANAERDAPLKLTAPPVSPPGGHSSA